jgi:hypothetical protein
MRNPRWRFWNATQERIRLRGNGRKCRSRTRGQGGVTLGVKHEVDRGKRWAGPARGMTSPRNKHWGNTPRGGTACPLVQFGTFLRGINLSGGVSGEFGRYSIGGNGENKGRSRGGDF